MTKEQLAELLNGNEYRDEMTKEQEQAAKQNNLLVLFGASDDLLEMRGAIRDEVGAYDGGEYAAGIGRRTVCRRRGRKHLPQGHRQRGSSHFGRVRQRRQSPPHSSRVVSRRPTGFELAYILQYSLRLVHNQGGRRTLLRGYNYRHRRHNPQQQIIQQLWETLELKSTS